MTYTFPDVRSLTFFFCRDHLDQLEFLEKMELMDSPAPLAPLDLEDVLERLVLLCVALVRLLPSQLSISAALRV